MHNIHFGIRNAFKEMRKWLILASDECTAISSPDISHDGYSPLEGQSYVVARCVQRRYGGHILTTNRGGRHFWNELPDGLEIDLTSCELGGNGIDPAARGRRVSIPKRERMTARLSTFEMRLNDVLDRDLDEFLPKGSYCYGIRSLTDDGVMKTIPCPFLARESGWQEQECGFCNLIDRGDFMAFEQNGTSLLWDAVKECGLNIGDEQEFQTD